MLKLMKGLKPFLWAVIAVLALTFGQSLADLQLPNLMSDIVNTGIANGGVEDAVPRVVRASRLELLLSLMSDSDAALVREHYTLLETGDAGKVKTYPLLSEEPLWELNARPDEETEAALNSAFSRPMLLMGAMTAQNSVSSTEQYADFSQGFLSELPPEQAQALGALMQAIQSGEEPAALLAQLPPESAAAVKGVLDTLGDRLSELDPTIRGTLTVSGVKAEYGAIGWEGPSLSYILRIGGLMLLVAVGGMLCTIAASYLSARVSAGFGSNLRERVFTRVTDFSLREFDKLGTATLITRTTNDITQIQMVMVMLLRFAVMSPIMFAGGLIMAWSKDPGLTWIMAAIIPVIAILMLTVSGRALPMFKAMQKKVDRLNLVLRESLTGIRVIRAFNRIGHDRSRFDEANQDITDTAIKVNRLMAFMMPGMMLIMNLSTLAVLWFGALRIDAGNMMVGNLIAFMQYVMQVMFSLVMLSMIFIMLPRASASADRVSEVLAMEPTILDPETPKTSGGKRGSVEFRDVSFYYPGAQEPALSGISFTAGPGEVTAIIGGTGSGKTTLINLLPRFYDVSSGSVLVDGVDVREYTQHALREKLGYVPQKALLFSGTVRENLLYGSDGDGESRIREVSETAQAAGFVEEMPEGYEALLAQGGQNLSGGQKQRLTIARALMRRPEIYIFDDNFSALDFKTDAKLRAALRKETKDATVLIVAQRVSTIMDADRILVLDNGQVAGLGSHRELMESCEVYREIVYSQLSKEELA